MKTKPVSPFRLRSFVRRDSRRTAAQERAYHQHWPAFGLAVEAGLLDLQQCFGRDAPKLLEIGFGSGQSLLASAMAYPEKDFIGVETHKPGIGSLLLGIEANQLTNIRLYHADVIDVLTNCIGEESLSGVQIFFPDPWPKRRHHLRRLIQHEFIEKIVKCLQMNGSLHLATDWEDYAKHMMQVVSANKQLLNTAGLHQFAQRSHFRPVITKFEKRAMNEGRHIWELQLIKCE